VHELALPAAMERLVADVQGFCGGAPAHDDMTLMLVERQPARDGAVRSAT
jgi:serine phosphatase RsbU (regulator of sigma subunit)